MVAKVKKVVNKVVKKSVVSRSKKTITQSRNVPSNVLSKYPIIIHGEYGVGKTSLVAQFPKTYFNMFEPNDSYDYYLDNVESWEDFLDFKEDFLKGNHDYLGYSIDNSAQCYDYAMDYACKKYGFEHPGGMNDYGSSWSKVKKTFIPPIRDLMLSKYGLIITCHTEERPLTTLSGKQYNKLAPMMNKQAYEFLCAQIPNIFYYFFIGDERWMQIVGDEHIVAKNKFKGHFLTEKGEQIFRIPMGYSEEEAYKNLIRAFNNEQKNSYRTTFMEKSKKFKKKISH